MTEAFARHFSLYMKPPWPLRNRKSLRQGKCEYTQYSAVPSSNLLLVKFADSRTLAAMDRDHACIQSLLSQALEQVRVEDDSFGQYCIQHRFVIPAGVREPHSRSEVKPSDSLRKTNAPALRIAVAMASTCGVFYVGGCDVYALQAAQF